MKLRVLDRALALLAEAGVTVCCSCGDFGSRVAPGPGAARGIEFPAASPTVVACGGTAPGPGTDGAEVAWKEQLLGGVFMAGGGGMSGWFPRPAFQQAVATQPAADTWIEAGRGDGHNGRWIPDVSALASFAPGYAMLLGGEPFAGGGTSAATPVWAALLTRIALAAGRPLGRVVPLLYSLAGTPALRDVVSGDNDVGSPTPGSPHYSAGPGWDPCTGLGSPDGMALLTALRQLLPRS
jgi:kumamolisin